MTSTVENLKTQADALSTEERADLAYYLLRSLDEQDDAVAEILKQTVKRHAGETRSRKVAAIDVDKVLAEMRVRYP